MKKTFVIILLFICVLPSLALAQSCDKIEKNGLKLDITAPVPSLFKNIKHIYIVPLIYGNENSSKNVISSASLGNAALCVLQDHLNSRQKNTPVSVLIPDKKLANFSDIEESKKQENLITFVKVQKANDIDQNHESNIVIVQINFFRHGINEIDNVNLECASAFIYKDSKELQQILLPRAIHNCVPLKL